MMRYARASKGIHQFSAARVRKARMEVAEKESGAILLKKM
jgi:hypothetical protein